MPVDSRISFDEVEAGVVVISLKLVVDFFEEGKKVLASRFEAIVLEEASVGNVVKLEPLVFIAVVDIFIVVLVVVVPRLFADGKEPPNSVFASAIDKVDDGKPPVGDASSMDDDTAGVEVAVDDDATEEEEEEEESVVIESPA